MLSFCCAYISALSLNINGVGNYLKDRKLFQCCTYPPFPFISLIFSHSLYSTATLSFFSSIIFYEGTCLFLQLSSFFPLQFSWCVRVSQQKKIHLYASMCVSMCSFFFLVLGRSKHLQKPRLSCLYDCGLLLHSVTGWLSASPPDPIPETTFSQSTLSSTHGRHNQSGTTRGKHEEAEGRAQSETKIN